MNLKITEKLSEMIAIGKEIALEKKDIYNERTNGLIMAKINKMMPEASEESKQDAYYQSLYDYWAYGFSIDEEFCYGLINREGEGTDEYKSSFISFRSRFLYTRKLNNGNDTHYLKNKYDAYKYFTDFYQRDVIEIAGEEDFDKFAEFVKKHPVFVAKPEDLGRCVGVHKVNSEGRDVRELFESLLNEGAVNNALNAWGNSASVVCEEIIKQSEAMSKLHPASANCMRCSTIRVGDEVHCFYPWLKVGIGGDFVTGATYGSLMVGVDWEKGVANTDGFNEACERYVEHPDTHIKFIGYPIPDMDDLKKKLKQLSDMLPTVGYIGWDMVHTDNGWVVMEGNDNGEFVAQIIIERGFREELENILGWKPEQKFWWE